MTQSMVIMTAADVAQLVRQAVREELGQRSTQDTDPEAYVAAEAVARRFGVSRATVHTWVHKEGCPHEMRGKILRFRMGDVEAWFRGREPTKLNRVK